MKTFLWFSADNSRVLPIAVLVAILQFALKFCVCRSIRIGFKQTWSQNLSQSVFYWNQRKFYDWTKAFCSVVNQTFLGFWDTWYFPLKLKLVQEARQSGLQPHPDLKEKLQNCFQSFSLISKYYGATSVINCQWNLILPSIECSYYHYHHHINF